MNINFECTTCGKCCHDLRLPLCVDEALTWLDRGGDVQIICEAVPWPEEPPSEDLQAAAKHRRSFPAISGTLPTRIMVILAGVFTGACPNLQPDMRCGIYEERPLVCRIYPAEISPFIELVPTRKACPPEAWTTARAPLMREGKLVDSAIASIAQRFRVVDEADVKTKQWLCSYLQIDAAAWSNEGYVLYSPERKLLRMMLQQAKRASEPPPPSTNWRYVSNRRSTVEMFLSVDADSVLAEEIASESFEYLGLFGATS
ncbi:YkgJ family cysteine cluster protein [Burkholderia sp. L27(2015)]|uniref:YkgJ family cysteine cluster protein n=1 Tax=Burkholderia sp. L27(2015) TaxID=1641858 RepID=UPI00131CEE71|nr:YkgJ family cysteine cluster protein [Burkholderia sp. L27(2015)]